MAWAQGLGFEVPIIANPRRGRRGGRAAPGGWAAPGGRPAQSEGHEGDRQDPPRPAGVKYAILGEEETCTGDTARRAGNEYLFQQLAQQNIETLNGYKFKLILTQCPHCLNTLLNEYPQFGGHYQVMHHTQYIEALLREGQIKG